MNLFAVCCCCSFEVEMKGNKAPNYNYNSIFFSFHQSIFLSFAFSLLRLCKECLAHSFRMALKAHGLLARIFANISDAPSEECDSGVTLHAAALLFILSRDKLAAGDLDKAGLQLLLRLLRCDASGLNNQQVRKR